MHLAKPDARCYKQVIHEQALKPEETLYFDDLAKNIEAGIAAGFVSHQVLGDEWLPITDSLI